MMSEDSFISTLENAGLLFIHIAVCRLCVYFMRLMCLYGELYKTKVLSYSVFCVSAVELRQAIVAMMNRKDELEEQNAYVRV